MKLTRRGEIVVQILVALVVAGGIAAVALIPPGWWLR